MAIPVRLNVFEGPLDLLLHLIDKNKVDIYDIPIVTITDQYLEYIKAMEEQDMNIMSEFLLMAATLIDIKCKMLLPREVGEDGEEEDPREELVQKLLEYKMYKFMSFELKDRQLNAQYALFKSPTIPKEVQEFSEPVNYEELIGDMTLAKLHEIFKSMVKRQEDKIDPVRSTFGKIEKDEVDIGHKASYIDSYIRMHKKFSFKKLLEKQGSKQELIVTFLVILEMIKVGRVSIEQEDTFGDIIVTQREDSGEEFDVKNIIS